MTPKLSLILTTSIRIPWVFIARFVYEYRNALHWALYDVRFEIVAFKRKWTTVSIRRPIR